MLQQIPDLSAFAPDISELDDEELAEWLESLDDVVYRHGKGTARALFEALRQRCQTHGFSLPFSVRTPFVNSVGIAEQPEYPGDPDLERKLLNIINWNATAMVVRANRDYPGIGGHLASYASIATLFDVGFHHFFRARNDSQLGDLVYLHGHSSPGVYARAFVEGRLSAEELVHFRREAPREAGLSSYPHPWLMPRFWQFPTVSMGLGPLQAIYQARFLRYLAERKILDTSACHVWCFAGDGEMDEPEAMGALALAAREGLDNLTLVVNCNLQRLDGPVRPNSNLVQELEGRFRGAGWNAVKLIWGSGWDEFLEESDPDGLLARRLGEITDGQYQKYTVESGEYIRKDLVGDSEELQARFSDVSDAALAELDKDRGGHDSLKTYAAYDAALRCRTKPTVVLARTIKGYGLGEAAEALNVAHKAKKLSDEQLQRYAQRLNIPLEDDQAGEAEFYLPDEQSDEVQYLRKRREELGGFVPSRETQAPELKIPDLDDLSHLLEETEASTTLAFGRLLTDLLKDDALGPHVVPIIPDEARTFGLEPLFARAGIYTSQGQQYEPVDAGKLIHYRQSEQGQLLEEGITEAGAMASFIAAGTSYSTLGCSMVPFYLFYSIFGFQRVGDLIWASADARSRGFLLGCTAGRTTLNGEGLQHQDGHSQLVASTVPTIRAYDPAYAYEMVTIVQEGMRRMYVEDRDEFYYLTLYNESYEMPGMAEEQREGILRGMYRLTSRDGERELSACPQLLGSGSILPQAARAQQILADDFDISSDLWSVTSYSELRRDALEVDRWNGLHPQDEPRTAFVQEQLAECEGMPFVAATDFMKAVPDQIARWVPGPFHSLGTDGFGRSDTRKVLRKHFEVNAAHIAYAALRGLADVSAIEVEELLEAQEQLGIDPEKLDPATA